MSSSFQHNSAAATTTTTMKSRRKGTRVGGGGDRFSLVSSLVVVAVFLTILNIDPFSSSTTAFFTDAFTTHHYPPVVAKWLHPHPRRRRNDDDDGGDVMCLWAQKQDSQGSSSKKKKDQVDDSSTNNNKKKSGGTRPRSRLLIRSNNNSRNGNVDDGSSSSRSSSASTVQQSSRIGPQSSPVSSVPDDLKTFNNRNEKTNQQEQRLLYDKIACRHFGEGCSGCVVDSQMANVPIVESARRFFSSTALRRQRVVQIDDNNDSDNFFYQIVIPSKVTTWRTQAKLAVASKSSTSTWANANPKSGRSGCVFGLYQQGSHQVLPIPDCMVHHPSINVAIAALEMATAKVATQAAAAISSSSNGQRQRNTNEKAAPDGGLRYVQCQVERSTGKVALTLIWHAEQFKETQPALPRLVKELQRIQPDLWHSIWCHCNNGYGNNIFHRGGSGSGGSSRDRNKSSNPATSTSTARGTKGRQRWYRLMGPEYLREPIPRVNDYINTRTTDEQNNDGGGGSGWLYYTPYTFRQGNSNGFDTIACNVAQAIPPGSKVCELYAGVGVLSLTALVHHHGNDNNDSNRAPLQWIRCSDENPANPRCFDLAVASLPENVTKNRQGQSPDTTRSKRKKADKKEMTLAEYAEMIDSGQMPSYQDKNNNDDNKKTRYLVASATQALRTGEALGANVLIVDPPRKGLEEGVLEELCKPINRQQPYVESATSLWMGDDDEKSSAAINWTNDVRTLIYVSCGFDALASDTEKLLFSSSGGGGGGWRLKSATGYILFPGSNHVETVCVFERR